MKLPEQFKIVGPRKLFDYLLRLTRMLYDTGIRVVGYAEGPPGVGKSAITRLVHETIAGELGLEPVERPDPSEGEYGLVVVHFGNISEEVAAGLPWVDKATGMIQRGFENIWPRSGRGILFLDEPFQTNYAQRFVAQIVEDGRIGDYILPPGWQVILAGNSSSDRAGAKRLFTHTQNRVVQFVVEPDVTEACRHFKLPCLPEIGVFLRWFPEHAFAFDPSKTGPFPSLRIWDKLNSLMHHGFSPVDDFEVFQGAVGYDTASDFRVCVNAVGSLPNIDAMLAAPNTYRATMQNMEATTAAAFASVVLKRYEAERDADTIGAAIQLVSFYRNSLVGALCAMADEIDKRVGDGDSVYDTPEYAQFVVANPHLVT